MRGKPKQKSKGLGDDIAMISEKLRINKLATSFAVNVLRKADCGCAKRQDQLNKLFPHR